MNHIKCLLYLSCISICITPSDIFTFWNPFKSSSKKSTATQLTTLEKKENNILAQQTDHESKTCPNADKSLDSLSKDELKELLICTQNQKNSLEFDKIIIEEKSQEKSEPEITVTKSGKKPKCPHANKPIKKLPLEALKEMYAHNQKYPLDPTTQIALVEQLITLSSNDINIKDLKLQRADLHYSVHHIEKAAALYEDFGMLYPASKEAEYAWYKALVSRFELALDADKDQTNTRKTIEIAKEFLKLAQNTDLIKEAATILMQSYERLYDHEVYVFTFYLKKKNFTAAQMRLDYIAKNFEAIFKDLATRIDDLKLRLDRVKNPTNYASAKDSFQKRSQRFLA